MNGREIGTNGRKTGMIGFGSGISDMERILMDTARRVLGQAAPLTQEDSLRVCGLDSISIVEWMLTLERQEIRVAYEDIAGAETIRELAKLLAARNQREGMGSGSRERETVPAAGRKLLCRLANPVPLEKRRGFVVAVPYAGMGIQSFSTLAKAFAARGYELLACNVAGRQWSVSDMAERIAEEFETMRKEPQETVLHIKDGKHTDQAVYAPGTGEELVVLGCCVGSALAIRLVQCFRQTGHDPACLALVGSLPMSFLGDAGRKKLLWDLIPAPATEACLSVLQGRRIRVTGEMLSRLKSDAKHYVQWMENWQEPPLKVDTHLFFGSRDVLTGGFRQKYNRWDRYLSGSRTVTELAGAYHFCLHTHGEEIAKRIAMDRPRRN